MRSGNIGKQRQPIWFHCGRENPKGYIVLHLDDSHHGGDGDVAHDNEASHKE
jgi:hypothetical protein